LLGFLSKTLSLLKSDDAQIINRLVIYLSLPALIFQTVRNSPWRWEMLKMPLVAWTAMVLCLSLAWLVGRMLISQKELLGSFILVAAVGNTGYLGYPLTLELLGEEGFFRAIFYDLFGTALFIFTVGIAIAEFFGKSDKKVNKLKKLLTFPPLISLFLGLFFSGISLPPWLEIFIERLGQAAIPLILISVGLSLEFGRVKPYLYLFPFVLISKLLLSPLIVSFFGKYVLSEPLAFKVALLESSMPTALLTLVIGIDFGLESKFIASTIVLATLSSFFTLYLIQMLL
jgi:hypothetical protein